MDTDDTADSGSAGMTLEAGFEAELTYEGGCSDMVLYAWKPDDTVALRVDVTGLVAEAYEAGTTLERSYDLSEEYATNAAVRVETGANVSTLWCGDVVHQETVVEETWTAITGTADFSVTPTGKPDGWEKPASATVVLSDLLLQGPDRTLELPALTISSGVGWYPG